MAAVNNVARGGRGGGCEAVVVHCMDFRLQSHLKKWLEASLESNSFDLVSIAGGVYDLYDVIRQVDLAVRLHDVSKAILINHEDCGAYGLESTDERHETDLRHARDKLNRLFPQLQVELYYLGLDGTFESID